MKSTLTPQNSPVATLPLDTEPHIWSDLNPSINDDPRQNLLNYYSESLNDYDDWSQGKHMHFGYSHTAQQAFNLESMLEEMSRQVMQRLSLNANQNQQVIDLGCGLGASCRFGAKNYQRTHFHGVSIVPSQISYAQTLNQKEPQENTIDYKCADYTHLPYSENSFHAAYAIESSCYASGLDKRDFLSEAYRVLKPGSHLVVADGFLKNLVTMGPLLHYFHKRTCQSWAVETLADIDLFTRKMQQIGFKNINVEDISWKVAPSFAFIPFVVIKFLLKEIVIKKRTFNRLNWGHVFAPFYASVLGLSRNHFGYYLITAEK